MTVSEEDGSIIATDWGWGRDQTTTPLLALACDQLQEYFDGLRTGFDLPIALTGSSRRRRVLLAASGLAYGQTTTCAEFAASVGGTASGVGRILAGNPLPILVPSHRIHSGPSGRAGLDDLGHLLRALEARQAALTTCG